MSKTISATILRSQLSTLLDQLQDGETHFIIERNNQPEAVLLNMRKFQEIMQMLELLNRLELIGGEPLELEPSLPDFQAEFDDASLTEPEAYVSRATQHTGRTARSEAIETAAARLGIRLIK